VEKRCWINALKKSVSQQELLDWQYSIRKRDQAPHLDRYGQKDEGTRLYSYPFNLRHKVKTFYLVV